MVENRDGYGWYKNTYEEHFLSTEHTTSKFKYLVNRAKKRKWAVLCLYFHENKFIYRKLQTLSKLERNYELT